MPHVSSSGPEDLASTDEVKVYNDEGEEQEEQRTSEDISEVKLGLVTETEQVSECRQVVSVVVVVVEVVSLCYILSTPNLFLEPNSAQSSTMCIDVCCACCR